MTKFKIHAKLECGDALVVEGDSKEVHNKIIKLITLLPEHCQHTFYLIKVEGIEDQVVASLLNISVNTVEEHVHEAFMYIRENLEEIRNELSKVEAEEFKN